MAQFIRRMSKAGAAALSLPISPARKRRKSVDKKAGDEDDGEHDDAGAEEGGGKGMGDEEEEGDEMVDGEGEQVEVVLKSPPSASALSPASAPPAGGGLEVVDPYTAGDKREHAGFTWESSQVTPVSEPPADLFQLRV
jgi:hypothetical protein